MIDEGIWIIFELQHPKAAGFYPVLRASVDDEGRFVPDADYWDDGEHRMNPGWGSEKSVFAWADAFPDANSAYQFAKDHCPNPVF